MIPIDILSVLLDMVYILLRGLHTWCYQATTRLSTMHSCFRCNGKEENSCYQGIREPGWSIWYGMFFLQQHVLQNPLNIMNGILTNMPWYTQKILELESYVQFDALIFLKDTAPVFLGFLDFQAKPPCWDGIFGEWNPRCGTGGWVVLPSGNSTVCYWKWPSRHGEWVFIWFFFFTPIC